MTDKRCTDNRVSFEKKDNGGEGEDAAHVEEDATHSIRQQLVVEQCSVSSEQCPVLAVAEEWDLLYAPCVNHDVLCSVNCNGMKCKCMYECKSDVFTM